MRQNTKKEGIDMKTTRRVSIQLGPGPEAGPIKPADVVSPTDGTGHPRLTCALRRRATTRREGCRSLDRYVQAALLILMDAILGSLPRHKQPC